MATAEGEVGKTPRIHSLDSLRGMAALSVVVHHSLLLLPAFWFIQQGHPSAWNWFIGFTPLHMVWAGQEAVIIFFVLSGYVLSGPFWKGKADSTAAFLTRRVMRLYPAYFAALIFSYVLLRPSMPTEGVALLSGWWHLNHPAPSLVPVVVIEHLFMYVRGVNNQYDVVIWSLVVEMQVSFVFPLLIRYMRRAGYASVPVALVVGFVVRHYILDKCLGTLIEPPVLSMTYVWFFVLGAELSRHQADIEELLRGARGWGVTAALVFASVCYTSKWTLFFASRRIDPLCWAIGAAAFIVAAVHIQSVRQFLQLRALRWIGAISYSLYLLHFPILMFLAPRMAALGAPWVATVFTPPLALAVAYLSYRVIEVPGIALGSMLSKRILSVPLKATVASYGSDAGTQ